MIQHSNDIRHDASHQLNSVHTLHILMTQFHYLPYKILFHQLSLTIFIIVEMGRLPSNSMAATLTMPSMAFLITILLLNPIISNAGMNDTESKWCDSTGLENCLVGDLNSHSEFLMLTESSGMLVDQFLTFQTPKANDANKESVPDCSRPPRYDSCLGSKRSIPNPEPCSTLNRVNPC